MRRQPDFLEFLSDYAQPLVVGAVTRCDHPIAAALCDGLHERAVVAEKLEVIDKDGLLLPRGQLSRAQQQLQLVRRLGLVHLQVQVLQDCEHGSRLPAASGPSHQHRLVVADARAYLVRARRLDEEVRIRGVLLAKRETCLCWRPGGPQWPDKDAFLLFVRLL